MPNPTYTPLPESPPLAPPGWAPPDGCACSFNALRVMAGCTCHRGDDRDLPREDEDADQVD